MGFYSEGVRLQAVSYGTYSIGPCECCGGCDCGCTLTVPVDGIDVVLTFTGPHAGTHAGNVVAGDPGNPCCYVGDFGLVGGMGPIGDNGASCEVGASLCCKKDVGWQLTISINNVTGDAPDPCHGSQTVTATTTVCDPDPLSLTFGAISVACADCAGSPWTATGATVTLPAPFAMAPTRTTTRTVRPLPTRKPCDCKKAG